MPRTRPPYPKEFREEAVRLVKESGKTVSQISRELGVSVESLRGVGKAPRHRCGRARGPDYRRGRRAEEATPGKPVLREERDILKKVHHAAFGTTKDENDRRRSALFVAGHEGRRGLAPRARKKV